MCVRVRATEKERKCDSDHLGVDNLKVGHVARAAHRVEEFVFVD